MDPFIRATEANWPGCYKILPPQNHQPILVAAPLIGAPNSVLGTGRRLLKAAQIFQDPISVIPSNNDRAWSSLPQLLSVKSVFIGVHLWLSLLRFSPFPPVKNSCPFVFIRGFGFSVPVSRTVFIRGFRRSNIPQAYAPACQRKNSTTISSSPGLTQASISRAPLPR